jgi:phage baseplate assembly protein W
MNVDYPYRLSGLGRTAEAADPKHVRDLIEQLLFTAPGERVNRPTFGCGLRELVFAPNSVNLAAATQFTVQASLQQYLGDLVEVRSVTVSAEDSTLRIGVEYLVRGSGAARKDEFTLEAAP